MNNRLPRSNTAWPVTGFALALMVAAASAQTAPTALAPEAKPTPQATPVAAPASGASMQEGVGQAAAYEMADFEDAPPLQVGDAASSLLAWQRDGGIASPTPRPIAGDVARRSYERYLKSFEYPIPERLNSTVKTGSNTSGSK
ncbi:Protein of unknown function [Variovorax sp. YR752]|uniref:DUF3613 domain-containing protein n=1 Tax=Variovorax sp. YR752 TaxID=1884383 RepID=UPI000BD0985A|nr:DUF3613 domain-containing protein [Variovorax sp. YR752]SOD24225.1 Protein of unknown function [Variovorax sp. YR752]